MTADEPSRTPAKPCYYDATVTIAGQCYTARARGTAAFAMARVLVAASIADQPVVCTQQPRGWRVSYRSLHRMAGRATAESPAAPVRTVAWRDPIWVRGNGEIAGETAAPVLTSLAAE